MKFSTVSAATLFLGLTSIFPLTGVSGQTLAPIRKRLEAFKADPGEIDRILAAGSAKAAVMAAPTLEGAYRALGLPR